MALPATDSFTDVNGTALSVHSDWTENAGTWDIQSNTARISTTGDETCAHWDADAFNDGQYSEATYISGGRVGPGTRIPASAASGYVYTGAGDQTILYRFVASARTVLGSGGPALSGNEALRLESTDADLHTPYLDGEVDTDVGAQTDSTLTSGSAGIGAYASGDSRVDDWEGGNLGAVSELDGLASMLWGGLSGILAGIPKHFMHYARLRKG